MVSGFLFEGIIFGIVSTRFRIQKLHDASIVFADGYPIHSGNDSI